MRTLKITAVLWAAFLLGGIAFGATRPIVNSSADIKDGIILGADWKNPLTYSGLLTLSLTGGNAFSMTGTPAASATAALAQLGAAPVGGSAQGQYLNINAANGFTGNLIRGQVNDGTQVFNVDYNGAANFGGTLDGILGLTIDNTNAGTSAYAEVAARNTANANDKMRMMAMGTGYTTAGGYVQDAGVIAAEANLSGGLSLIARNASGAMRMYTGGFADANERMRITSGGAVGIGTTGPDRTLDVLDVTNPQLRLTHTDATYYTDFQTDSAGKLTVTPSGGTASLKGLTSTATLGSELILNGDFATNDLTNWTDSGANWSGATGKAVHTAGVADTLTSANISVTDGTTYEVEFTTSTITAGSVSLKLGTVDVVNSAGSTAFSSNTTYKRTVVGSGTSTQQLVITPTDTFAGALDNITVKAVTLNSVMSNLNLLNSSGSIGVEARSGGPAMLNTLIGVNAGRSVTGGTSNTALGNGALAALTTGNNNIAIGASALGLTTIGATNTAIGYQSLYNLTNGTLNFGFGSSSLYSTTTGSYNQGIGSQSLYNNTTGNYNIGFGHSSLLNLSSGSGNVALGSFAARFYGSGTSSLATSTNGIFLGYDTRPSADSTTGEVVIGASAVGNGSNTVTLGNTSTTGTYLAAGGLTLSGQAARTAGMARHTTSNTAGNALTLSAGGSTSGATDKAGGDVVIAPGLGTGTGKPGRVRLQATGIATGTSTSDNTLVDRLIVQGGLNVTDESANNIFEVALPTLAMAGGMISWTIRASDGTEMQATSGISTWTAVNKGGSYTTQVTENASNVSTACSTGTLTGAWTIVTGTNKITLAFTPTSSLVPTTCQLSFTLHNNSPQAVTYL